MGFRYQCILHYADGTRVESRIEYMDGDVADRIRYAYIKDPTVTIGGVDCVPGINPIIHYECFLTRTIRVPDDIIYVYEYREEIKDCREAGHDVVDGKIYDFCKTCRRKLDTASKQDMRSLTSYNTEALSELADTYNVVLEEGQHRLRTSSSLVVNGSGVFGISGETIQSALEQLRERIREEERMGLSPQQIMVSRQQYDRLLAESELYNSTNTGLSFHGIDIIPEQPVEFRREYQVEWVDEPGDYRPNRYGYSAPLEPSNGTLVSISTPDEGSSWFSRAYNSVVRWRDIRWRDRNDDTSNN